MANCVQCGRKLPAFVLGRKICQWCLRHEAAQRGEEPEDAVQPLMRAPWAGGTSHSMALTQVFFGINVAVFAGMALAKVSLSDPSSSDLLHWGANAGLYTLGGDWWRLITCLFVHGGIIHIAINMWCLWSLGNLSESLYGHWTFGAVYLISGFGASLSSVAWRPHGLSVGASGAIFGLAGALIASYSLGEFSMPRAEVTATLRSVVIFVGYSLIFGSMSGRTDNAAHIGGLVTGLALGALIAKAAPDGSQWIRRVGVLLVVLLALSGGFMALEHSQDNAMRVQRAGEFLADNHPDQAITELERAIRQHPNDAAAHAVLAEAYSNQGEFAKAEAELQRLRELLPGDDRAAYDLGFLYLNENRPQPAREMFLQLLTRHPNSAGAHFGLGLANAAGEKYQEAVQEFLVVSKLNPNFEGLGYRLGLAQAKLKNYDDAIAAFRGEQQKAGDSYEIEIALADAYRAKAMPQQADEAMHKAAQLK